MALDATVEGAAANSYATVAEYKAYWGDRPQSTIPLGFTDAEIETGLEFGCVLLTACFNWNGTATTSTQALPWPRTGLLTATRYALDKDTNPAQLKNAQIEWAANLLSNDRTADNPDAKTIGSEQALLGLTAGPVSLQFEGTKFSSLEEFDAYIRSLGQDFAYLSKMVPDIVRYLLVKGWYKEATLKRKILFGAF